MNIQLTQVYNNNVYKDDMYVTIANDNEIESLLYLRFYNNINKITVELLQSAKKQVIRKIMLMEHIDKIIYRNKDGAKEEINTSRKLIIKMPEKEESDLISDDGIIKFQQILDINNNTVVVQNANIISDELLNILQKNDAEYIRIMDYGKNKYTIQQIRNIKSKVKGFIELASQKTDKLEKFIELYKILAQKVSIDRLGMSCGNICDIIYGKTIMQGYAEILKYILDEMQIENKIITGNLANGEIHYWNQVKVNHIWYNVDLALDAERVSQLKDMKYCLMSDEDFYKDHIALSENIEICNFNSNILLAKEIGKNGNFIKRMLNKISGILNRKKMKKLNTGVERI